MRRITRTQLAVSSILAVVATLTLLSEIVLAQTDPLTCMRLQDYRDICRVVGPYEHCSEELTRTCCECEQIWGEDFVLCDYTQGNPPPSSSSSSASSGSSSSSSSSSSSDGTCQDGDECIWEDLDPASCAEVNGFLEQVNIATVINLSDGTLPVSVAYRDLHGIVRGRVSSTLPPLRRQDFIVNDLGLQPDSYGTVCVATGASARGAWTGRVTIYKPNTRNGRASQFGGNGFDYALDFPFTNKRSGSYTLPLNTFHLGLLSDATVANWIQLTDASPDDGFGLTGALNFYDAQGQLLRSTPVDLPDGGRFDYSGHDALTEGQPKDLVGMARFIPSSRPGAPNPQFYLTAARYMYDCRGHTCSNFRTAFSIPSRPPTHDSVYGGVSTVRGEVRVVEVNNFSDNDGRAELMFGTAQGQGVGTMQVDIPARGTRHVIVNRAGESGFLAPDSLGCSQVSCQGGMLSTIAFGYKLDKDGGLSYGYSIPFVNRTHAARQVTEFNSFLNQINEMEYVNTHDEPVVVRQEAHRFSGPPIILPDLQIPANGVQRIRLNLLPDEYGLVVVNATVNGQPTTGVIARSYVNRDEDYVLSYPGR